MPDETYTDTLSISVGGEAFELFHDRGETDDATWVWSPERRVLFAGDMFIWASPNCGNPQKVQRYARDWAVAFRKMLALEPEVLLPGHGLPIVGAARVQRALTDAAELLESLVEQTLALMNEGARLDDIVQAVRAPEHLLERPYLRGVRRARVRGAQPLAALRRLVRRRSFASEAGPGRRARARDRGARRWRGPARGARVGGGGHGRHAPGRPLGGARGTGRARRRRGPRRPGRGIRRPSAPKPRPCRRGSSRGPSTSRCSCRPHRRP